MAKVDSSGRSNANCLNVDFMRSLVKQYSELGQWTSAFFWADAAAAAGTGAGSASGDDIWLLASTMLARGELHRAAHAITSRGLHRTHLLCLGLAMRAYISAKEPSAAVSLFEHCDTPLLDPRDHDHTHNRALASVLVWEAKALAALERRDAAAEALTLALRADCACYEALELLLEQHALTPHQEIQLIESLPISCQFNPMEATLLRSAYRERLLRYAPLHSSPANPDHNKTIEEEGAENVVQTVLARSLEGACRRARRLAAAGHWKESLRALEAAGDWACVEVRVACLVELRRSAELFAYAHSLVDSYPHLWTSWYAVGCYYYLIGKSDFARRYLSKAKSLEPGAGCIWLAYGHSFAADNEHDQAMAAYFKASQLMAGCHLPPLYVGVECSLLNNVSMCERFLLRAAMLHSDAETGTEPTEEADAENRSGWDRIVSVVREPQVAHEAGVAAFTHGHYEAAHALWLRTLETAHEGDQILGQEVSDIEYDRSLIKLHPRWAATLDGLGHACRSLGRPEEGLRWHERALALRPARSSSMTARALCLSLLGREPAAADALHAALARNPDDVVAIALLDAIIDRVDTALTDEEIPQFPFPKVDLSLNTSSMPTPAVDATNTSDMSMSFD